MVLPPELERELTVIELALPGKEELRAVLGGIMPVPTKGNPHETHTQNPILARNRIGMP
jgi:hypothetical protein